MNNLEELRKCNTEKAGHTSHREVFFTPRKDIGEECIEL